MTVDDLRDRLTELSDDGYGDCPVRLAFQPSWPLAFDVGMVGPLTPTDDDPSDEESFTRDAEPGYDTVVWIAEGGHPDDASPYAPRAAWSE